MGNAPVFLGTDSTDPKAIQAPGGLSLEGWLSTLVRQEIRRPDVRNNTIELAGRMLIKRRGEYIQQLITNLSTMGNGAVVTSNWWNVEDYLELIVLVSCASVVPGSAAGFSLQLQVMDPGNTSVAATAVAAIGINYGAAIALTLPTGTAGLVAQGYTNIGSYIRLVLTNTTAATSGTLYATFALKG